jgi:hypothetical protein
VFQEVTDAIQDMLNIGKIGMQFSWNTK